MLTVINPSHDPFYNQAFEEYVYQTFLEDDVFLLWQNDPAVIVGSYQNICREVHVESLRRLGIPWCAAAPAAEPFTMTWAT